MGENREKYLEKRVSDLTQQIQGLTENEAVLLTYIGSILEAFGCTSEETGVELDINEISQSLDKFEVIGVPTGGTRIKMFAREKTEE